MTIARKPKKLVHSLIAGGGKVGSTAEVPVKLRVPEVTLRRIDAAVAERQKQTGIRTGLRHAWLLEAVEEKLARS